MKLGQFLREQVGIEFRQIDLYALDRLAGKQVGDIRFYGDIAESFGNVEVQSYTSPFFYPIGSYDRGELGLHLHPHYLDWEHLIVARNDHDNIFDLASTFADFIFRYLLNYESICYENDDDPEEDEELIAAINTVNAAFGAGFYQIGRFGRMYPETWEFWEFEPPLKISFARAIRPVLYNVGLGKTEPAARHCNRALSRHRNTTGYCDRDQFYQLCHALLAKHPEQFTPEAKRELAIDRQDKTALAMWCVELYETEKREWCLKVLFDLCEIHCSYNHPLAHRLMVKLLGENPAGKWVQYRQIPLNPEPEREYEDWERILLKIAL